MFEGTHLEHMTVKENVDITETKLEECYVHIMRGKKKVYYQNLRECPVDYCPEDVSTRINIKNSYRLSPTRLIAVSSSSII